MHIYVHCIIFIKIYILAIIIIKSTTQKAPKYESRENRKIGYRLNDIILPVVKRHGFGKLSYLFLYETVTTFISFYD